MRTRQKQTNKPQPTPRTSEAIQYPSVAEQLGTDDPVKQAEILAAYRKMANTRPVIAVVYHDPRNGFTEVNPLGGEIPIVVLQEVLILGQQYLLHTIQKESHNATPHSTPNSAQSLDAPEPNPNNLSPK